MVQAPDRDSSMPSTTASGKRAGLAGGVVADGKNEVEHRRPRRYELIPAFAAVASRWHVQPLQRGERQRMHFALGLATCRVRPKAPLAQFVEDAFGEDGACGIACADEQCVVCGLCGHGVLSQQQEERGLAVQQAGAMIGVVTEAASWKTGMLPNVWKCSQAIPCGSVTQCFSLRA